MEITICKNAKEASKQAAQLVAQLVKAKPDAVLGLATGGTPLALYDELIRMYKDEGLSFAKTRSFNLDEYVGLPPENHASYRYFMNENFFDKVDIDKKNTLVPDGLSKNIAEFCAAYEEKIANAGGIDLQVLGIGSDGHIGFNEPTSSFASRTRVKTLAKTTLADNARFFGGDINKVPLHAISMGIGTIMESKKIVLLAFGKNKAEAVREMAEGAVSASVPATILQFHKAVSVFIDEDAASELKNRDFYDWVSANTFVQK